jgi:MFS family permease
MRSLVLLLSPRNARRLTLAKVIARLPGIALPLALLAIVEQATHSFAFAGATLAVAYASAAITETPWGRLSDRYGPQAVIKYLAPLVTVALLSIPLLVALQAPAFSYMLAAAVVWLLEPPYGSVARAAWEQFAEKELAGTAAAFETASSQLLFTVGPLLSAVAIALKYPAGAFIAGAMLEAAGAVLFVKLPLKVVEHGDTEHHHRPPLRNAKMLPVLFAAFLLDVATGMIRVALPAKALELGSLALAGPLIAAIALGTVIGGLAYGAGVLGKLQLSHQLALSAVTYAACCLLLAAPHLGMAGLLVICLIAGVLSAPLSSGFYLWSRSLCSQKRITETYALVMTAFTIGEATGPLIGGVLIQAVNTSAAILLAGLPLLGIAAVALLPASRPDAVGGPILEPVP